MFSRVKGRFGMHEDLESGAEALSAVGLGQAEVVGVSRLWSTIW